VKWGSVAAPVALCVALALGTTPAVADDVVVPPADPAPVTDQWTRPAPSVSTDPQQLVEESGDTGAMTVVYAVQDGDSLRIETQQAPSAGAAEQTIADVQADPAVVAVEVDTATRRLTGMPHRALTGADPARGEQWALDTLRAETAWTSSTGTGVTVAVIDSGVARHPDLDGLFVRGKDFVDGTDGRADPNGHGTHVAGIIAMTANNAIGGAGLAPGVSIMPVVVADAGGSVRAADSAQGIVWAVDHGADVLNMSYSGSASSVEQKAIQYAQSKGVVTVAAVGNAYLDSGGSLYNPIQYPAAFPGVLGVGAVTRTMKRSSFSEVGKQVDIVAPGGSGSFDSPRGIFSTYSGGTYVRMPGTSMATPYVTATVALALSRERTLGLSLDTEDLLLGTATDLGSPGRDDEYGFGLVDPVAALDTITSLSASGATLPTIKPSEITTRKVRRILVDIHDGYIRYKIPATGRFIVAWEQMRKKAWSDPIKFKGKHDGRVWYRVRTSTPGMKVRILAIRSGTSKNAPIWISPTFRTRAGLS